MKHLTKISALLIFVLAVSTALPQTKERKDIPDKYKWNLADEFASKADWQKAADKIKTEIDKVAAYKGKLGESASTFKEALQSYFNLLQEYYLLSDYSSRIADQDVRVSENQELNQVSTNIGTQFSEKTAFLRPEILRLDPDKIKKFFAEEKGLADYKHFVEDIERTRTHTLSESGEEILASFGLATGTPSEVYTVFNNAEMPNPGISLSTGQTVKLDASGFTKFRSTPSREDREKIFNSFFSNYGNYQNTIGSNLAGKVKLDYVYAKDRSYPTSLAASVDGPNIPVSVYENLITQIHNNLPTLHRFLKLKKKMLGVDTLHYYDLYTPIVKKVDMHFTIEEGHEIILKALKPLGDEYISTLQKAFANRWVDYMPNVGKRSGAYSSGAAYGIHPFILMNWNDDYESLTTLGHELGHTMHSYFSNKTQPFVSSDYPTFVAEIASTFNENLLNNYMVQNAKSNDEKLFLLGTYLELLRTTIFRQTLFAEFELEIHKYIENGQPLTGEKMTDIYYTLVKKYYGNDEGVCKVDPYIAYEWEYIPHFINYTYYVYQYSTSLIYATALAEKVITNGKPAVDNYYNILKGGSSEYPVELIKKAGVDPLSSEAFDLTINKMNKIMDQIEAIIK